MQRGHLPLACLACLLLTITACTIGPQYQRPEVRVPTAYKELPPASFKAADGWKAAQPNDEAPRGKWWEVFQDPELNALEEQVDISNQTLAVAEAQTARRPRGHRRGACRPLPNCHGHCHSHWCASVPEPFGSIKPLVGHAR